MIQFSMGINLVIINKGNSYEINSITFINDNFYVIKSILIKKVILYDTNYYWKK